MKVHAFLARLLALILAITTSGALAIELIFYHVMTPTYRDIYLMATVPAPWSALITVAFIIIVLVYAWPVASFLRDREKGETITDERASAVQARAYNLPYFMALAGFFAFLIGSAAIGTKSLIDLNWPVAFAVYGLLAGVICGLMALPLYLYFGYWAVRPVIEESLISFATLGRARKVGFSISLERKLAIILICLVAAASGYLALVGFSQTTSVLDNMEKMEAMLTPEARDSLKTDEEIESATDPGVRATSYYRARLGSLAVFYFLLLCLAVLIAAFLGITAARGITRPIGVLRDASIRFAQGEYDEPVRLVSNDEFADLAASFNRMMDTLRLQIRSMEALLDTLKNGILQLDDTSNTVLEVAAQQAAGATEQAAAAEETSIIAEEIVATAKQIAERARLVEGEAAETLSASKDGEDKLAEADAGFKAISAQVADIRAAMSELEDRFQETYKFVEWISDISDQTELLALNAALEAAGAGEAGRRFAVVAESTRRLAGRAAEASQEIKSLVESIQESTVGAIALAEGGSKKVAIGDEAIRVTTDALGNISKYAGATSSAVQEISLSAGQQENATEQLAASVAEVNEVAKVVQQGASEIEESIAKLREFTESLREILEQT